MAAALEVSLGASKGSFCLSFEVLFIREPNESRTSHRTIIVRVLCSFVMLLDRIG